MLHSSKKIICSALILVVASLALFSAPSKSNANGKPWLNSNLIGNVTKNTSTNPKDDLYLSVNKDWILNTKLPGGYASWSNMTVVYKDTVDKAIKMLSGEKLSGHDGELVQTLFKLCTDMNSRNKIGIEPFKKEAEKILAAKTLDDIKSLWLDEDFKYIADFLLSIYIEKGISDSETYYVHIDPMGLMMEDSANYSEQTEYGEILKNISKEIFEYMMKRIGMKKQEVEKRFSDAIAIETKAAKYIYTSEEQMSSDFWQRIDNPMTLGEIKKLIKNYPLEEILNSVGLLHDKKYMVSTPEYMKILDELYTEENVESLKSLMLVSLANKRITMLDKAAMQKNISIAQKYYGVKGETPIEEKAFEIICAILPDPIEKEYIKKYSSEKDKKIIEQLCYDVIDTYRDMLLKNDWASKETINYAVKKLESISVNVGWPEKWDDYSALEIGGLSYYEAMNKISKYNIGLNLARLGTKPDKKAWAQNLPLLDCNAFYDYNGNSINMIIGMMGRPFYYPDMPIEELYASLGAFWIGHEVSHAFDSIGAQYDINGNLKNWWNEKDIEEFNKRVKKVDEYLNSILIMGDYYVNGSNVDSELIADFTGLQCALKMAEKIENFDYKKFFEYFCKMNVSISLYTKQLSWIQGDPHPLDYLRANVPVQQFEEFYKAYGITEGDNMYLAPEKRITVW